MFIDKAMTNNQFLEKALQASAYKAEIINSNIANADTPGYKRKVVDFDLSLQKAVDNYKNTGIVELNDVNPAVRNEQFTYRIDGNGVVMEQEMIELYQNATRYDVMIGSANHNFRSVRAALGK